MFINKNMSRDSAIPTMREQRSLSRGCRQLGMVISPCVALLCACTEAASADETLSVSSELTSTTLSVQPGSPSTVADQADADRINAEMDELRRGYGAVDMRFGPCVTRRSDSTLIGQGCPSGFVVYGPYVAVPAKSEIEISFELKPSKRVEVYADIVTRMAAQTLAGLNRQIVEAGINQKLGYRVYVFSSDVQVESRIGLSAESGTDFEITNLTMSVR